MAVSTSEPRFPAETAAAERTGARWRAMRRQLRSYFVAVAAVIVGLAIRALLQPLMEDRPLLVLYVPGVMLAAFWGGVGAGLLATLLSLIGSLLLFQSPTWDTPGDLINDATFLLVGVGIAFLGEGLRRTRAQADARTAALASREAHLK